MPEPREHMAILLLFLLVVFNTDIATRLLARILIVKLRAIWRECSSWTLKKQKCAEAIMKLLSGLYYAIFKAISDIRCTREPKLATTILYVSQVKGMKNSVLVFFYIQVLIKYKLSTNPLKFKLDLPRWRYSWNSLTQFKNHLEVKSEKYKLLITAKRRNSN